MSGGKPGQDMDQYVRIGVNRYKVDTLENNWNEERFDINYIKQLKPTLSVSEKKKLIFLVS